MELVIVESPNKCKKIQQILGNGFMVAASVGHIADLPKKEIGVEAPSYEPNFALTDRGKKTVAALRSLVQTADTVWLATDPDREGEAIAVHLAKFLKLKNPKRIVFNEITNAAVKSAIKNPREIDRALYEAQKARRVIDRLVGYKVSAKLYRIANQPLSAGRVQSVALRLVVDRERNIRNFKPTNHFGVKLLLCCNGENWVTNWDPAPFVDNDNPYVLEQSLAQEVANTSSVNILEVKTEVKKQQPPAPFITTTLQKAANIELGLDSTQAMQAAQKLFENGHITYHRTDNPNLSNETIPMLRSALKNMGFENDIAEKNRSYKTKANAQEAHEAIRPTDFSKATIEEVDPNVIKLYEMIRIRALASQMRDANIEHITVRSESPLAIRGIKPKFVTKSSKILYLGWMKLTPKDQAKEQEGSDEEKLVQLPVVNSGDTAKVKNGKVVDLKTKTAPRYTEPSLISKLEQAGIGRPATYASILANIKSRGYLEIKGKTFIPSASAELIVDILTDKFSFMELGYTKFMEDELDEVASGKKEYLAVVMQVDQELNKNLNAISQEFPSHSCPECRADLQKYKSKTTGEYFWGCSRYKDGCKTTMADQNGKPQEKTAIADSEYPCPDCNNPLRRIKGKHGYFWGCSQYQVGCKTVIDDNKGKPAKTYQCTACKRKLRKLTGDNGIFWACTGYKEGCKQTYNDHKNKPVFLEKA